MKKYFYKNIPLFLLLFSSQVNMYGQGTTPVSAILTADSLASGNYKDVLTSFFKLALNNLTGPDKEVKFTTNLFAYMLKHNPTLNIDTNYVRYTPARNTNVDLNVKFNEENNFNGFAFGLKYAIVNSRDYTISKEFIALALSKNHDLYILHDALVAKLSAVHDQEVRKKLRDQIHKLFNDSLFTFDQADTTLRRIALETAQDSNLVYFLQLINHNPTISFRNNALDRYNEVKNSFQNKPLWTASLNLHSYDDNFQLQTLDLSTEFLKGIVNPNSLSNLELDLKSNLGFGNDSLKMGRNLNRTILNWDVGVNWVMKGWNTGQSFLEFKLSGSNNQILSGLYLDEKQNNFTLNGTIRFRISNEISIPVEFKYDPKTANVFGLFNITSNFTWL